MDNRPNGFVKTADIPLEAINLDGEWFEDISLTASLSEVGQIHAISVYQNGDGFGIVAGRGRVTSARALEWETIRADIYADELSALALISLAENVRRANPLAAGRALISSDESSDEELLRVSGLNKTQRDKAVALARLDVKLQREIEAGRLKVSGARLLLKLPESHRVAAWEHALATHNKRKHPRGWPTLQEIDLAVRAARGELQPQFELPAHVIEAVMVESPPQIDPVQVASLLRHLLAAHDALTTAAWQTVLDELENL